MRCKMVGYYRVSTEGQGTSGLGLEAQKEAVARHVAAFNCDLIAEYVEIESAAKDDLENRPQLQRAIAHAKRTKATLVIAKLDRLARSVYVTDALHKSGVEFAACDMPNANKMTIQFMAVVAEGEARMISERTKAALKALKDRGVPLGASRPNSRNLNDEARRRGSQLGAQSASKKAQEAYRDLVPSLQDLRSRGNSYAKIAKTLNEAGEVTRRDRPWSPMQVARVLARSAPEPSIEALPKIENAELRQKDTSE